jgi:5-formyltetrahydrofolate cyclo-ligase
LNEISLQKKQLRREAGERRLICHAADAADGGKAGLAAAGHFMAAVVNGAAPEMVAAYWAVRDELATQPLLARLNDSAVATCLPVVAQAAAPLVFRRWRPGAPMVNGVHDIPIPDEEAPEAVPVVLVVPMLAFDAVGYRLGYGGGYYDRTLQALRSSGGEVLAVGFAYEEQEIDDVPHDHLDQPLDWVVTERGARKVQG